MSQESRVSAPKFGSFKPKGSGKNPESKAINEPVRSPSRHRHPSRDDGKGEMRHRNSSRDFTGERSHHRFDRKRREESQRRRHRSPSPQKEQDEFEASNLFIIDRRGDSKNVEYGSLHRYNIPAYHRTGYGHVIGTSQAFKIDRDASTEKQLIIRPFEKLHGERRERLLTAKHRASESKTLRLIAPVNTGDISDDERDFIELRSSLKRKLSSEASDVQGSGVDYRSIEGRAKSSDQPLDDDLEYASEADVDEVESSVELLVRQENAALSKRAKDNPSNADAWLVLINHQEKLIHPGADPGSLTALDKRTLADIRLSIYHRALKHIPKGSPGNETLILGSIEEGSLIWETSRLAAKWNDALTDNPSSVLLWTKYLDFVQTNHTAFRYEKCKQAYMRCLKIMQTAFKSSSESERPGICRVQIYILLRFTAYIRDAGYDELAYAIWQVLLEYQLFKPPDLRSTEAELESLESFWESDVPRIGEEGALGWNQFTTEADNGSRHPASSFDVKVDPKQVFTSFADQEGRTLGKLQLPTPADDDTQCDDPFRYIMFSDLQEVIECLPADLPKTLLIEGFLLFMHLPPLPDCNSNAEYMSWQSDPYLRTEYVTQTMSNDSTTSLSREDRFFQNQRQTTFMLFGDSFRGSQDRATKLHRDGIETARFVDRVLDKLVSVATEKDILAEYYLAFKLQIFPLEISQFAKRLLKARPSSLRLYNAYALTEARLDRLAKAKQVWSMALGMSASLAADARDEVVLIWHNWMLTLVNFENDAEALGCLVSMADDPAAASTERIIHSDVTAGQRLKVTRHLEAGFEQMRMKRKSSHAVLYIECLGWLFYLLDDHALDSTLQLFRKYSAKLSNDGYSTALELLHQAKAGMVRLHLQKKRPYKPAVVRSELAESIRLFPANSLFLNVYAQVAVQSRIDDRLRDVVKSTWGDDSEPGLIRWSFYIAEEIRRCHLETSGSTQNSVRANFGAALLSSDGSMRHSIALWTFSFQFECSVAKACSHDDKTRLSRVKQVFYDGLRYLPWCKAWIIMGLKYFSCDGRASDKELRQIYDVLAERELRVRADVEGIEGLE